MNDQVGDAQVADSRLSWDALSQTSCSWYQEIRRSWSHYFISYIPDLTSFKSAAKHSLVKKDGKRGLTFFFSVSCFPLSRAYEFERNNHAKYLLMIIFIKAHNGMEVGAEGEHIALYAPPPPKNHYKKKRNQWIVTCLYRGSHLRIDPWVSANNTSAKWINGGSMNTNSGVVQPTF